MLNRLERIGENTLGEGIIDQKIRHAKQVLGARMFDPIPLQSAEVVRVAQFGPQLLENPPIFLRSVGADFADEVALQICCHSVVIQQRVVYVEQEDDASRRIIVFVHFSVRAKCCAFNCRNASRVLRQNATADSNVLFPPLLYISSAPLSDDVNARCDKSCSTPKEGCSIISFGAAQTLASARCCHRMMCYLQE